MPPRGRICTKFGTGVGVADVITCIKFWRSVNLKGIDSVGGRNLPFPILKASRR